MSGVETFDKYAEQYDNWYEQNSMAYESELAAVRHFLPDSGTGLEIGVGTGRFAGPLGIKRGVEPSRRMRAVARERGIDAVSAMAEDLPYNDKQFDYILMVTVICFLDDVFTALKEARRVLKDDGVIIIGFIDRESPLGQTYEKHKNENEFYKHAVFYSTDEVRDLLHESGFKNLEFVQTIFKNPSEINEIEEVKPGYGKGSFVVVKAENQVKGL